MEEINIFNPRPPVSPRDEGELLIICEDFKKRMDVKNRIIYELKMDLMMYYGLAKVINEYEDVSMVEILLDNLEKACIKHLGIETPI